MRQPTELILLDLGRVLVRICDNIEHACRVAGIDPRPCDMAKFQTIGNQHERGEIDCRTFYQRIANHSEFSVDEVEALSNTWLLGAFDGVEELFDRLLRAELTVACLSNTNASHWRIMNDPQSHCPLPLHRLHHRFASHLVGAMKPDAAIYEHVERATGTAPRHIVFFDDHVPNIAAATQRGWHAVQIDITRNPPRQIIECLTELGVLRV